MPRTLRALAASILILPTLIYCAAVLFTDSRAIVLWERGIPEFDTLVPLLAGTVQPAPHAARVVRERAFLLFGRFSVELVPVAAERNEVNVH